jgi:hypothetical protein
MQYHYLMGNLSAVILESMIAELTQITTLLLNLI